MATVNIGELATTTLRHRSKKLADNVTDNIALLMRLKERGRTRPVSGGRVLTEELAYAENSTYKRYSGYETLDISPSDQFDSAEYDWKQAAMAVTISGLEELRNNGAEASIDLLASRIENAERSFMNNLSADIYSDGTADGGKQIGGLQLLVSDDGTGTVGGIVAGTYTWWKNQFYDFSTEGVTAGRDTIQAAMNELFLNCSRNRDRPDLIVADNTYFRYYWESLQAIQRVQNDRLAQAGFENLKFMGADVVFDGGLGGDAPASHMYFINSDYLHYRPHRNRNMTVLSPDRYATNQDAMVRLIGWAGNMTCSNRSLQGVIVA